MAPTIGGDVLDCFVKDISGYMLKSLLQLLVKMAWEHWSEKRAIRRYERLSQSRTASLASGTNTPSINHRQ